MSRSLFKLQIVCQDKFKFTLETLLFQKKNYHENNINNNNGYDGFAEIVLEEKDN